MDADTDKPLRIAIVACEPSADRQGAALLRALRALTAPRRVEAWGIGGAHLRAEGVTTRHDSDPWATLGIAAVLTHLPHWLLARADIKRALARDPPDALVLIDAGAFSVPLGRWAKARRLCPVLYYFPPGSWRRSPGTQGQRRVAAAADAVVTPFPWSEALLRAAGTDAHFVGHPLLDLVRPVLAEDEFWARYGLDPHRPLIALLPGSRRVEIQQILPPLLGAAGEIARRIPGAQFALALAPSAPREMVERIIRREQGPGGRAARLQLLMHRAGDRLASFAQSTLSQTLPPPLTRLATSEGLTLPAPPEPDDRTPPIREYAAPAHAPLVIVEDLTYDVMARSDLVLTKSGTSTLEAAILHKPMIIMYRVPPLMALEVRLRWKELAVTHIGMPNILAGERVLPELLQDEATPEAIADLAVGMLLQPERLLALKERLTELVRTNLGEPGGVRRAAALLQELITRHR